MSSLLTLFLYLSILDADSMEVTPTSPGKEEDTVSEVKEEEKEDVKGERELPVHEAAVSGAEGTTGEVSVEEQEKKQVRSSCDQTFLCRWTVMPKWSGRKVIR